MKKQLQLRLEELKHAFSQGQTVFNELKDKQADTHDTLLRLQGAIQVIEEMLTQGSEHVSDEEEEQAIPRANNTMIEIKK